ncbi:MAG: nucleotide exchange factor GrpE, partial [Armatimonadota bacterium]|nr:nucleotide exchange factor GrpE [Armatimonadota bacterium]
VAKVELVRSLLPAIDNLERALNDTTEDAEVVRKGVRMTYEQLIAALAEHGVKGVPTQGAPFDPNVHEAVDAVSDTDHPADTVIEDVQKGYTLGNRLVRAARVRVAR